MKLRWQQSLKKWRGETSVETDLTEYRLLAAAITEAGRPLKGASDDRLRQMAADLKERARAGVSCDELLIEVFALAREAADRVTGLRPFEVQVMAAVALHRRKLVEMQTGEGKTLVAVLPACLNALTGRGVHVLTFNDYLARRDAAWMGPVYSFLGLSVGVIQSGMSIAARRAAYAADVTYATAKEAGFDFLRMHLCRHPDELVHRPFHLAIVDEADSILIDEARVPLVIAGETRHSDKSPDQIAQVVAALTATTDWETDENRRNVSLTEQGIERVERALGCGDLHAPENYALLIEVSQALHARALLERDVDYIVRGGRIELVDEFTGRVVADRRLPDGLQAALEAREGVPVQPGGRILGSITLPHFLKHYPGLCGMTATAQPAAEEFEAIYGLKVVPIPSHQPCRRADLPDLIFTHQAAKQQALIDEISAAHTAGRPVLVGTGSVEDSEQLAARLRAAGINCQVLNAKNDEAEAAIIAEAGAPGAVTISTNMAGRGADIRLGGAGQQQRERVLESGGLLVIGVSRHESRRIDDQLRGRAGRQGDPGASRFYVSLDDDLLVRFGIDHLIPPELRPSPQPQPVDHPVIRREAGRLQRIIEGQNYEIRKTLWSYSSIVERQRQALHDERMALLTGAIEPELCATLQPELHAALCARFGAAVVREAERAITLHHIDECWADHLAFVAQLRESIHLVGIGRQDPLYEFHQQIAAAFAKLQQIIEARVSETFATVEFTAAGIDLQRANLRGPAATWTYLINDRALTGLQQMLFGHGSTAFALGAVLSAWPLLLAWKMWQWMTARKPRS